MSRRLVPVCTLVVALALTGCGAGSSTSGDRLAAVSADAPAVAELATDLHPLTAEAVELAERVLAAAPGADVAAVVTGVRATSTALLADLDRELAAAGGTPGEVVVLTQQELQAIRSATDDEAVRLGVAGLFRNHLAALNRAKAAVTEGAGGELANRVLDEQGDALQELAALG